MTPRRLKSPASRGYRANASANSREAPDRSPFSMADWMASMVRSTSRFWLRRGNRAQSNNAGERGNSHRPHCIAGLRKAGPACLRRLDQLDFERDLDLVAHHRSEERRVGK